MRFTLFIVFLVPILSIGQSSKSISQERIEQLRKNGIDSIVYFDSHFSGGWIVPNKDSCSVNRTELIIWRYQNQTHYQKIVTCSDGGYYLSKAFIYDSSEVFDFVNQQYKNLENSYMMPAVIKWIENGKEAYQPISSNHPNIFEIGIYYPKLEYPIKKSFQEIWVVESLQGSKNLNFEYNQSNAVKKLTDLIIKESQFLESMGALKF